METSKLLFIKKGTFKSGSFSKKTASEFTFFSDKIIIKPLGWNRFFNSAEIFIFKDEIINYKDGFAILGFTIILETKRGKYWLSFLGEKLTIMQIFNNYYLHK